MASNDEIAALLIDCQDRARMVAPISEHDAGFDVGRAYEVLALINARREAQGWRAIGRKIGFTNRTIWSRYGVYRPMWAPVWDASVHFAPDCRATLPLAAFVQPRIEPEVVFRLSRSPPETQDPGELLACIESMAPGFEIVHSVFPDWKFSAADCTAASGLHGALVIGPPVALASFDAAALVDELQGFELTLSCGGVVVDRGIGSNVLGSPINALAHLVRVLAGQPQFSALEPGEWVTTGTITDAWPVKAGEAWTSDYGNLAIRGMTLEFS